MKKNKNNLRTLFLFTLSLGVFLITSCGVLDEAKDSSDRISDRDALAILANKPFISNNRTIYDKDFGENNTAIPANAATINIVNNHVNKQFYLVDNSEVKTRKLNGVNKTLTIRLLGWKNTNGQTVESIVEERDPANNNAYFGAEYERYITENNVVNSSYQKWDHNNNVVFRWVNKKTTLVDTASLKSYTNKGIYSSSTQMVNYESTENVVTAGSSSVIKYVDINYLESANSIASLTGLFSYQENSSVTISVSMVLDIKNISDGQAYIVYRDSSVLDTAPADVYFASIYRAEKGINSTPIAKMFFNFAYNDDEDTIRIFMVKPDGLLETNPL